MTVLELDRVTKRFGRGAHEHTVLREVSLQVEAGDFVAIFGARRSGRSTLLRVAAGVAAPDSGAVRFEGHDLCSRDAEVHRMGIGYCHARRRPVEPELVLEQLITDQLTRGVPNPEAEERARSALARVRAEHCATAWLKELDAAEAVRVAIARAYTQQPKLLVLDEPTLGVRPVVRNELLDLLRSFAEEGIAVLMTTGDTPCLSFARRALHLDAGELHGETVPRIASVHDLNDRRSA